MAFYTSMDGVLTVNEPCLHWLSSILRCATNFMLLKFIRLNASLVMRM